MASLFDYALPRLKTTTIGFKPIKPMQPYRAPVLAPLLGQQQNLSWSPSSRASSLISSFQSANPTNSALQSQYGTAGLSGEDLRSKLMSIMNSGGRTAQMPGSVQTPTGAVTVDYLSDPMLQQVIAMQQQRDAAAQSAAISRQKQLLIDFGSPEFASKFLGDQSVAKAAGENPFSVLGGLKKDYETRGRDLNQNLAKANLFYSGERGRQMGLESDLYLKNQTEAQRSANSVLGQIAAELAAQKQQDADMVSQAMMDAYNRQLSIALMYGVGTGDGGTGGTDPGTAGGNTDPNEPARPATGWGASGGPGYGMPSDPGAPPPPTGPNNTPGYTESGTDSGYVWDGQRWVRVR